MCKPSTAYEVNFYNFKSMIPDWKVSDYDTPTFASYDDALRCARAKLDEFYNRAVECGEYDDVSSYDVDENDLLTVDVWYHLNRSYLKNTGYIQISPVVSCDYEF